MREKDVVLHEVEKFVAQDIGGRGVPRFFIEGELSLVIDALIGVDRVVVTSGFIIITDDGPKAETDGPSGTASLVRALLALGKKVSVVTDKLNTGALMAALSSLDVAIHVFEYHDDFDSGGAFLFAVERPGRAKDGKYYSMTGEDISRWVAPIDSLFLRKKAISAAIGDGGNEIGMGKIRDRLQKDFDNRYLSVVPTNYLVVSGVSNWGAYGIVAGLEYVTGFSLLHTPEEEKSMLEAVLDSGAVDGVGKKRQLSVDGIELSFHQDVLRRLKTMIVDS